MKRALYSCIVLILVFILASARMSNAEEISTQTSGIIDLGKCIAITLKKNFALKESLELLIEKEAEYYVSKDTLETTVKGYYKGGSASDPLGYEEMEAKAELKYKMPLGDQIIASGEVMRTNFTHRSGHDLSFQYRYPLAKGGGLIAGSQDIRRAQRNLTMQELQYFLSRQDIVLSVIRNYFDLLQAKKLISVNESAVENARDNLIVTRKKYDEGLVPKIDLTRAEIRLLESQAGLLTAIKDWEERKDKLLVLMGLDPRYGIEIDYEVAYFPREYGEDESIELAMLLRKELLVSGEQLFQGKEDVKIAENNLKPQVDIVASYATAEKSFLYTGIDTWNYPTWSAMLECSIDISKRSLKENLLKSKRLVYLYEQKMDEVRHLIVKEVRDNIRQIRLAASIVEVRDKNLKAAEERLHLATRSWEEGLIPNREVVDAQQDLVRAQTDLITAKIQFILAEYNLKKSIGYDLNYLVIDETRKMKESQGSRKNSVAKFLSTKNHYIRE